MTLINNEIHILNGAEKAFIISTADRRLTFDEPVPKKDKYGSGQKLFIIRHLNATVSFWKTSTSLMAIKNTDIQSGSQTS